MQTKRERWDGVRVETASESGRRHSGDDGDEARAKMKQAAMLSVHRKLENGLVPGIASDLEIHRALVFSR